MKEGCFDVTYTYNGFYRVNVKPTHVARKLFVLGDSFVHGDGVGDAHTFAAIMARRLFADGIAVYNAGQSGASIDDITYRYLVLRDELDHGDILVLAPTTMDFRRSYHDFTFQYGNLFASGKTNHDVKLFQNGEIHNRTMRKTLRNDAKFLLLSGPMLGSLWRALNAKASPDSMRRTRSILAYLRADVERRGAHFVFLPLPLPWECTEQAFYERLDSFDYVNILPALPSTKAEVRSMHFAADLHWNKQGHTLVADAVLQALRRIRVLGTLTEGHRFSDPVVGQGMEQMCGSHAPCCVSYDDPRMTAASSKSGNGGV